MTLVCKSSVKRLFVGVYSYEGGAIETRAATNDVMVPGRHSVHSMAKVDRSTMGGEAAACMFERNCKASS